MATQKQVTAAKRNIKKATSTARQKRSLANMPAKTKTALGQQGAAVARRKRTGASSPKTRQELYQEARRRKAQEPARPLEDGPRRARLGTRSPMNR